MAFLTSEEIRELFEKHSDEYLKFEHIPAAERLHPSQELSAYLKIASLLSKPEQFEIHGEHDIVYLNSLDDLSDRITEDDVIYLVRCGIHYDKESDCLIDFP